MQVLACEYTVGEYIGRCVFDLIVFLKKKKRSCLDKSEEPKAKQPKTEEVKKLMKPSLHYGATIEKRGACEEDTEHTSGPGDVYQET
ncbi:uncharacterized protein LOC143225985 isoform X3 [Tachypleus tridentatus]|uniref:uncharacterized protein LOC143225985 isoform X3 n=1 Tax=Tachypleus tridentatus TaxID=6853 RepID=UPI003FD3367B